MSQSTSCVQACICSRWADTSVASGGWQIEGITYQSALGIHTPMCTIILRCVYAAVHEIVNECRVFCNRWNVHTCTYHDTERQRSDYENTRVKTHGS